MSTRVSDGNGWAGKRPQCVALLTLGSLAILGLSLSFEWLPPPVAALAGTLPVILFPGLTVTLLLRRSKDGTPHPAEELALWFVIGVSVLTVIGFIGILTGATIGRLMVAASIMYLAAAVAGLISVRYARSPSRAHVNGTNRIIVLVLLIAAVALAFTTLVTSRSHDDWFYLAYIRDYTNGTAIGSEDAIFNQGAPASPRAWYGAWWVVEAMLSRATGVDPVPLHQVFLPILLLPFSVLALFAFARHIFGSVKAAYLACFVQVVYYISSAAPSDSAGWALLCKTSQDKTISCLIIVPIVVTLALELSKRWKESGLRRQAGTYALYALALVGSTLVHPMGAIWCGIGLLPFLAVEALRQRNRQATLALLVVLLPFLLSAAILYQGRVATVSTLEERGPGPLMGRGKASFFEVYVPGSVERFGSGDRVYAPSERIAVAHPSLITRYPLALIGLVLTLFAVGYSRRSYTARYLVVITFSILLLGFVPGVANITSALITRKMLYRLAWLFPWGLCIAFFLTVIVKRLRWAWLIALVITLGLCRGNPANYLRAANATKAFGRPEPELAEVLWVLAAEPSPQGVVMASSTTSIMIPGFVADAYPVVFRSEGRIARSEIRDLFQKGILDGQARQTLLGLGTRYIIAEKTQPIARGLEAGDAAFRPVFGNKAYGLWKTQD